MVYFVPQQHICNVCGYTLECEPAPYGEFGFLPCPRCWQAFLRENIGELEPTIKGAPYE